MARMRAQVREQNIYRWAGRLLGELGQMSRPALERHGTSGDTVV